MKKLFISVPMKGRTEKDIRESMGKMHKIAEATVGEPLDVIPSYIDHDPPKDSNFAVWYLGMSIQLLAEADYIVVADRYYNYAGCDTEQAVARKYGIPVIMTQTEYVAPDVWEVTA